MTSKQLPLRLFLIPTLGILLILAGCATPPTPIPAAYLDTDKEMSVDIVDIADKPQMRDSGQGGLIGAMVTAGRGKKLREKMEGVEGSAVKELVRQELTRNLEENFYIEEESEQLVVEVDIITWGWFLPTGILGIKGGDYQTEIVGEVRVIDLELPEDDQQIAYAQAIRAFEPLGSDPDDAKLEESLLRCADSFGKQVVDFLLQRGSTDIPRTF